MKTDAVSLDLETLGTDPGDVILTIGMVAFNTETGHIGDKFFVGFFEKEWLDAGYTYRESTREWWALPSQDEARKHLTILRRAKNHGLAEALTWLKDKDMSNGLWSRGYMDETMLKLAIRKELGIEDPWHYQAANDARTLLNLFYQIFPYESIDIPFVGTPHHSLDDAIHEAKLVHAALGIFKAK